MASDGVPQPTQASQAEESEASSVTAKHTDVDFDEKVLKQMGYKQELYRGFNVLMSFSFCFTAVGVVASISGLYPTAINTGGPVVLTWSWIVCGAITIVIGSCMAEICSIYPFAGSVYHWSGCMAPRNWAGSLSYVCGWFNFIGNVAGDAFFANSFATNVNNLITSNGGDSLTMGQQVGIMCAAVISWSILNYLRVDRQGSLNNFSAFYQISAVILIIISILVGCGQQGVLASGWDVFVQYNDGTGWDNVPYVVFIGLLTPMYAVTGYEAAGHMSEETKQAHKSSPSGIFYCCVVSVTLGFVYIMALQFSSVADLANTFANNITTTTGVFLYCNGLNYGLTLSSLLAIMMYFNGISSLTVTTRITYAMARDGAFPFSSTVRYVTKDTQSPIGAILVVMVLDVLLLCLNLATPDNQAAFLAITSIATIGFQMSYAVPIFIRITWMKNTYPKDAPFSLGRMAIPMGWLSVFWLTFTSVLFFFPTAYPVEVDNMNWTIVVFGCVTFIAVLYWFASARYWFNGPKRLDIYSKADHQFHGVNRNDDFDVDQDDNFFLFKCCGPKDILEEVPLRDQPILRPEPVENQETTETNVLTTT